MQRLRWLRLMWLAVAAVSLLLVGGWLLLATAPGQKWLATEVAGAINGQILGTVKIEKASAGPSGIRLEGVEVFDPAGAQVLGLEGLTIRPALSPKILAKEIHINKVSLEGPRVWWLTPEGGGEAGLLRAFAPRNPPAPSSGEGTRFQIDVEEFLVDDGSVWIQEGAAGDIETLLEWKQVSLTANGKIDESSADIRGSLEASLLASLDGSDPDAPGSTEAPLRLRWDLLLDQQFSRLDLRELALTSGTSSVQLRGEGDLEALTADIPWLEVRLHPVDLLALSPLWQPTASLAIEGEASFRDGALQTALLLTQGEAVVPAGGATPAPGPAPAPGQSGAQPAPSLAPPQPAAAPGTLTLQATVQPLAGSWSLRASGQRLDPSGFDARAPSARLDLEADLHGASWLEPQGTIDLLRVEAGGATAGPIRLRAGLQGERLEIHELDARLPGGRLQARGVQGIGTQRHSDLHFDLDAPDLRRLGHSLGRLVGDPQLLPPLEGALRASGKLVGPPSRQEIIANVSSRRLAFGEMTLEGLSGGLAINGLPKDLVGHAQVSVASMALGASRFEALKADLQLQKGRVRGSLDGKGVLGSLHAEVNAATNQDFSKIRLDELVLSWPRASWRLRQPAHVDIGTRTRLSDFILYSEDGSSISASGSHGPGDQFQLDLHALAFDVSRLPTELAPVELGLGGLLEVEASLSGKTGAPKGHLNLRLSNAAVSGEELLDATVQLAFSGTKLDAIARANGRAATVDAQASLPWPFSERKAAIVTADVSRVDLSEISRLLALPEPMAGQIGAEIRLEGTLARPLGTVRIRGSELEGGGLPVSGVAGEVEVRFLQQAVEASADLRHEKALAHAEVTIAGSAGEFIDDPGRWERATLEGRASAEGVNLSTWLPMETTADPTLGIRGLATLQAAFHGRVSAPRGQIDLTVQDGFSGGVGPVDLSLGVALGEQEVALELASHLLGRRFLVGTARVASPAEKLLAEGAWKKVPLSGELLADELEVASVAWALGYREPVAGWLGGTLRLDGNAEAPRLALHTRATDLAFGALPFGNLIVGATYADKNFVAEADAHDPFGGELRLGARWVVDLGASALAAGSLDALAEAPLDVGILARDFDLEFLESLSKDLRQTAGKLDGELALSGHLPLPHLDGRLQLRDGRISYTGHGDLRDIAATLEFSANDWQLRHFEAHEGGVVEATGSARRDSALAPFDVILDLRARRFAVMASDLNRAWLDAQAQLIGELDEAGFSGALDIRQASVVLPDTPNKNIQSLEPHPDFVVIQPESGRRFPTRKEPGPRSSGGMELLLSIASSRPIQLSGTDLSMEAEVDLQAALVGGSLALAGDVMIPRGFVRVMNRRFDVSRGRVSFLGPGSDPGDPRLDVQALHESPYAVVTVTVGGSALKPTIHLRSSPAMSEAEIAMLLATGRVQLKAGSGGVSEASGAASALGTVLTSQLKKGVAARLPVDVISFEAGEEGLQGSRLEAGTYVGDKIYFGYARRFEAQGQDLSNENEVRFEYQLAPRWSLEVTYGDAYVGGADVFWTRDF